MGEHAGRVAIVVNPSKFVDLDAVKAELDAAAVDLGWQAPRWYETTVEDPGLGQAQQALADGAEVVCPLGGDGTVRAVASALVDQDVPMGLLPGGTGNLLARNLGLPLASRTEALTVALTGRDARIDVGNVTFDDQGCQVFLVMCGVGMDAETMANMDEDIKAKVGWVAYLIAGARTLLSRGFRVRAIADGMAARSRHARTVVVGNCGSLVGGAQLMPDAEVTDGYLDTVILSPRGLVGWGAVLARVLTRSRRGHPSLQRVQSKTLDVFLTEPVEGELDGDPVGKVRTMQCAVRAGVLPVRLPAHTDGWT